MVDQFAERIALKIKETSPEDTISVDVMKFALIGILNNAITLIAVMVVGILLGILPEVLITAISFTILRLISGGYHFKSALACFFFTSFIFILIPYISNVDFSMVILNSISLISCIIFSPSNIREHIRVPEKYFFIFKLLSVLLVFFNYFLDNSIITLAFFAQSLTLITITERRGKNVEEENSSFGF